DLYWFDLIPVISFLLLRGECRYCGAPIKPKYLAWEILTGILFVINFLIFYQTMANHGYNTSALLIIELLFRFAIIGLLTFISIYDLDNMIILDKVLFPSIGVALAYRLATDFTNLPNYLLASLVSACFIGFLILVTKGKGMGMGDVKFVILLGLITGWPESLLGLLIAFISGALVGVMLVFSRSKNIKEAIPFGPFLSLGALVALFWGEQILDWYLHSFIILG
ncbi:MAG TPA: prepilin peptidase, partial [Candidatus Wirthbacteria bacterium]|nr:prepilin peptidase [Candidatus Wirthbacteria bacterium]